jgi:hypothetical protein
MYKKFLFLTSFVLVLTLAYSSYGGDGIGPKPKRVWWRLAPAATGPNSIFMGAIVAEDNDMPVDYNFTCTNDATKTTGWITGDPNRTISGLTPNTTYTFNIQARDNAGTTNQASINLSATTDRDTTPPVLRLDINYEADNNDANTQPGFTKFTLSDSGSEVNGVIIDIGGTVQSARRIEPNGAYERYMGIYSGGLTGDPCFYSPRAGEKIYRDFIFGVNPSGVTITLWGLGMNRDCNITIWGYDACSTGEANRVANWYANGTPTFDTNFTGGSAGLPKYLNQLFQAKSAADLYKYAFSGKATSDNLGRIILTSSRGPRSPSGQPFAFVNGLMVEPNNPLQSFNPPTYAHRPVPFNGTQDVPINTLLYWRKGANVAKHDLYLDVNETKVTNASRSSHAGLMIYDPNLALATGNTGYEPWGLTGFLKLDTTYYWRIDEVNSSVYKGEVWSFTTAPNFVFENFDPYGTSAALRNVWTDYTTQVSDPPRTSSDVYLEYTTVRDSNSMKYWYRNDLTPYYSESRATIGTGTYELKIDPNWDGINAKSLVLWFYGTTTNDPNEKMYVKLIDGGDVNGIVYYPYMNDVKEEEWHEWNLDLGIFDACGVDLTDVNRIIIGFNGDGTHGDSSMDPNIVYFEDVQLYASRCALQERSDNFVKLDYVPLGNPGGDCVIDYKELDVMADAWLGGDMFIATKNPGNANLVVYYPLNEIYDGNKLYSDPCNSKWNATIWNWGLRTPSTAGVSFSTPGAIADGCNIGGAGCLYFDGAFGGVQGGRMSCGTYGQANLGNGTAGIGLHPEKGDVNAITLSVWAKWSGPRTWDPYLLGKSVGLMGKRGGWSEDSMIWTFWISANPGQEGGIGLGHYSSGDTRTPDLVSAAGTMNPFIGQWVHIAATFPHPAPNPATDGNSHARIYLNGGEVADGPWRFSHGYDANIFLTIGQTQDVNAWTDSPSCFYGSIDEARIYNRALEPNEIAYLSDTTPEDGNQWIPILSPAEVYDKEPQGQRVINFKDFALVVNRWLTEEVFPPSHR